MIARAAPHQFPAGPGWKREQRIGAAWNEGIPDGDVDFGVELGGHVGPGPPDAVPGDNSGHPNDVAAAQMGLAVIDGNPGRSREIQRAEPPTFVRVVAAVYEDHHVRPRARGSSRTSWR